MLSTSRNIYITLLFASYELFKQIAKLGGMGSEKFDACLQNERLYQGMRKKMSEYTKKFAVDSTPTIIVNGVKVDGDFSSIEKMINK